MKIKQGDIFWVDLPPPRGSAPGYRHPYVVVQNNVFNASWINTVVICSLTSNLKRSAAPGNVLLKKGEANLRKSSVVNISQVQTVDKSDLGKKIGTLPLARIEKIIAGLRLLIEPKEL